MSYRYLIAADQILGVRTNADAFKWSYGITTPEGCESDFEKCLVRIDLEIVESRLGSSVASVSSSDHLGKYHYFSGIKDGDLIAYRRKYIFNRYFEIELCGLIENKLRIRVNRPYFKYVTHRFMNLHSIGYMMTDLASLLLLRNGYAPLHCSAFRVNDATVVVLAPPNTGKTLTTMMACMDHGACFISEDLAITDGSSVYAVPWTSTFRYYTSIDRSWRSRLMDALVRRVPLFDLIPGGKQSVISNYVDEQLIINRSQVTHLVILERGEEEATVGSPEQVYRKAVNLNRYEFNYHKAPAAIAYEFFNPALDLDGAYAAERRIISDLVENVDERWIVRCSDPTRYVQMIIDKLGSGARADRQRPVPA